MYFSPEHKAALIRIPKTGSTSAFYVMHEALGKLRQAGDGHETYSDMVERCVGQPRNPTARKHTLQSCYDLNGWRVIAFVRHPLDWLPSFYNLALHPNWVSERYTGGPTEGRSPADFLAALTTTPYDFFTHEGKVMATEVWRTEDMSEFAASFGVPAEHRNPTPAPRRVALDWTPRDLQVIKDRFHRELKHYPERPI